MEELKDRVESKELATINELISNSSLPKEKADLILNSIDVLVLQKIPQWESLDNNTIVIDHEDRTNMAMAKSIRNSIAKQRIAAVKHIESNRATIAEKIKSDTTEDKLWLKLGQTVASIAGKFEASLLKKEKTFERYQEQKILELKLTRMEELGKYVQSPETYLKDNMNENEYKVLLDGFKASYEAKEAQERQDKIDEQNRIIEQKKKDEEEAIERKRVSDENIRLQAELKAKELEILEQRNPIPQSRLENEEMQINGIRSVESHPVIPNDWYVIQDTVIPTIEERKLFHQEYFIHPSNTTIEEIAQINQITPLESLTENQPISTVQPVKIIDIHGTTHTFDQTYSLDQIANMVRPISTIDMPERLRLHYEEQLIQNLKPLTDKDKFQFITDMFFNQTMKPAKFDDIVLQTKYNVLLKLQEVYISKLKEYAQEILNTLK